MRLVDVHEQGGCWNLESLAKRASVAFHRMEAVRRTAVLYQPCPFSFLAGDSFQF